MVICAYDVSVVSGNPVSCYEIAQSRSALHVSCDENAMKRCSPKEGIIMPNSSMPKDAKNSTLVHEVIHHADSEMALGLSEQQVASLAVGLFAWMKDNPGRVLDILIDDITRDEVLAKVCVRDLGEVNVGE